METQVHISSKGTALTPDQETLVREAAAQLERFCERVVACRVVVSVPNHRPGGEPVAWTVRLAVTVPRQMLTISRQAKPSFREALEDAFDAARRRLQDYAREVRGDVKLRAEAPHGRVTRLLAYEGYGFLAAADGREIYFHRSSVPGGGFDLLTVGTEVRFVEVEGEQGPQASTVVPLGRTVAALPDEEVGGGKP